ncbi:MAG: hypothetical protein ACTSW1_09625 [Candidatus Hodarchaeales archaeon]
METIKGILTSGITLIKRDGIKNVYQEDTTPKESGDILTIISLIETKLRKLIRKLPEHENEVNDAIENLLIGAGFDDKYLREKERIVYSSKAYEPDFVLNYLDLVIEGKYCKEERREKEIIAEINDYITAFKTKYENIIFVVYDNGVIRDEDQFKNDLEQKEHVVVKVIKH